MKYPKISIMIPAYNQSMYIAQAIESALNQDYPNFEVIISDDSSTDETYDIIKKYIKDPRIRYYKNKTNLGRVQNYNKLLYKYTKGDWIINLDGDDFFNNNNYLTTAMKIAQKDVDIAFVFGDQIVLEEGSKKKYIEANSNILELIDGNNLFLDFPSKKIGVPHLSVLYNKQKAIKVGFYTEDIISSDWDSLLKLMINNKVGYTKKIAGVWRKHQSNESKTIDFKKAIKNFRLTDSVIKYVKVKGIFNDSQIVKWKEDMTFRIAKGILSKYLLFSDYKHTMKLLNYIRQKFPVTFYRLLFNFKTTIEIILSLCPPLLKNAYRWKNIRKLSSKSIFIH